MYYISIIPSFQASSLTLFTKSFCEVKRIISDRRQVCLTGPKGCGKSFIGSVLFIMMQREKPCLFLSPTSLERRDYFLYFIEQHKSYLDKEHDKYVQLLSNAKTLKEFTHQLFELIKFFLEKGELYLFIDFGPLLYYKKETVSFNFLLNCADLSIVPNSVLIMSVSSGANTILNKPDLSHNFQSCARRLTSMLAVGWITYTVQGFTDEETKLYLNHIFKDKKDISFDDITMQVGTNPLLLSLVQPDQDNLQLVHQVNVKMENFLKCNLLLEDSDESVSRFLARERWDTSLDMKDFLKGYTYGELSDEEYNKYTKTWFYSNQLMIETTTDTGMKEIRFNFPPLGDLIGTIIRNYVQRKYMHHPFM